MKNSSGLVGHALTAEGIVERAALFDGQLRAWVAECSIRRQVQLVLCQVDLDEFQ